MWFVLDVLSRNPVDPGGPCGLLGHIVSYTA